MTTPYVFTDAQLVDIRRFAGYQVYGTGAVIFPEPWFFKYYLAMEARLQNMTADEANVVITIYLPNLYTLELAIPGATQNLDTDQAAVWHHNKDEVRDRKRLFTEFRMQLCDFLGIPPGPGLNRSASGTLQMVV